MTGRRDLAASVKARLLSQARRTGDDFQTLLTTYALERVRVARQLPPPRARRPRAKRARAQCLATWRPLAAAEMKSDRRFVGGTRPIIEVESFVHRLKGGVEGMLYAL